jgi:hypothetical protein
MNRNPFSRVLTASLVLSMAGLAAPLSVSAQPDNPPPPRPMDAPLGGPSVHDRDVPGVAGSFGDDTDGQKRKMANRIPPRVMRQALGAIMGEDAPEDIRATPEQREKIQAYGKEFEKQLKAYIEEHRKELEELRTKIPEGAMNGPAGEIFRRLDGTGPDADKRPRGQGGSPFGGDPAQGAGKARKAGEEIPVEVRDRLRELAAGMPPFDQVYTKIWAELRPEQQKAVDARLAEFRDRQAKERQDQYVQKRVGQKRGDAGGDVPPPPRRRAADGARLGPDGPGGPSAPGGPRGRGGPGGPDGPRGPQGVGGPGRPGGPGGSEGRGGPGGPEGRGGPGGPPPFEPGARGRGPRGGEPGNPPSFAERRERFMRILSRMSPEQQEQLLTRLEARMQDQGPGNRGPRDRPQRPARGEPRPAPGADRMPTPPMDEKNPAPPALKPPAPSRPAPSDSHD